MRIKNKVNIFIFSLFFPSISAAFFCPTNFNQIYVGDSIDQVRKQCGKPMVEETKEKEAEGPQEWSYFIPQTVVNTVTTTSLQPLQGTLKTQISFDKSGKAINISVNGIGVGSTTICANKTIQLGDTRDTIKNACGEPSFINKQNNPDATGSMGSQPPQVSKITTFTYEKATLKFVNGKLVDR